MNINKDLIEEINKLKINLNRSFEILRNDDLHKLQIHSIEIINYILKNVKIFYISKKDIPNFTIKNLRKYLLLDSEIEVNDLEIREFIDNLKKNKLTDNEIENFINNKNNELQHLFTKLLNINKNSEVNRIVNNYSYDIISKFLSVSCESAIIKNLKYNFIFKVKLDKIELTFNLFNENSNINNINLAVLIIKALYPAVLYNIKNANIKLNYYFTEMKKEMPKNTNFLGPNEINSGLTSFSFGRNNEITIFRKEEYEKLTLHEMIHALEIDESVINTDNLIENRLKCNFNISNDNKINFGECFTESIALISNVIIDSLLTDYNLNHLIKQELKFTILQCSKILKFYKLDYENFLCNNCCFISNKNWIEKTSVTAYYFCKLGIIWDYNTFIKEFMFVKNIDVNILYNFILNNLLNIDFLKEYKITDKLKKNLRMTINEFDWSILIKDSLNIN